MSVYREKRGQEEREVCEMTWNGTYFLTFLLHIEVHVSILSHSSIKVWLKLTSWLSKRRSPPLLISHMILKRPKHRSHVKNEKSFFFSDFRFVVGPCGAAVSTSNFRQGAFAYIKFHSFCCNEIKLKIQDSILGHASQTRRECR